jgi:GntR family transcriptional regulator
VRQRDNPADEGEGEPPTARSQDDLVGAAPVRLVDLCTQVEMMVGPNGLGKESEPRIMPIDQQSDRPVYQQIADALRERVRQGVYPPGSKLPSETELVGEFDVTRVTVRRGLAVLEQEGLTESVRGKGVFVTQSPPVLALRTSRFSRAARRAGRGALAAEAELLGEGQAAVKRRRMWVNDVPTQLADSYLPLSIDNAIGWSAGAQAPGGVYGLLEEHGYRIVRFREELTARRASPEESVALQVPPASPVVLVVRHAIGETGRVLEYFESVAAADKHRYVYEFDAPDD